jgi:signal transduction histidine kinase
VSRLPFRWRVLAPTLSLATAVAVALVLLAHSRSHAQRRRTLENTLGTKIEEVRSVLAAGDARLELPSFLALETRYENSPYEYFFELVGADGHTLLTSENLPPGGLGRSSGEGLETRPHPGRAGEFVRVRSQRLGPEVSYGGQAVLLVRVAATLSPLAAAARLDLANFVTAAACALTVLAGALWFVVCRSLRSVSAITRQAAVISSSNLRERLPQNGSGDELDRLSGVLNELFTGLDCSLAQMQDFTSDAAHQLRTPLTRIRGELDLALAGELAPETRASLEGARAELERLVETCARLLLLARLDRSAQARELGAETLDLAALARELVEQVAPLAEERGVRVVCRAVGAAPLHGSKALLAEALLNLLDNAIRYTPAGGSIEVEVSVAGREAQVSVRDDGPGIPAAERELVFRRFFRGRSGAEACGTGLGLAIVRGIARAHGGEVELRAGPGAHFALRLPAA